MNGEGDDPRVVTAQFAVTWLAVALPSHPVVTEKQIRDWASRGNIRRVGTYWQGGRTGRPRTVYDLDEIVAYVRRRGL